MTLMTDDLVVTRDSPRNSSRPYMTETSAPCNGKVLPLIYQTAPNQVFCKHVNVSAKSDTMENRIHQLDWESSEKLENHPQRVVSDKTCRERMKNHNSVHHVVGSPRTRQPAPHNVDKLEVGETCQVLDVEPIAATQDTID